MTQFNKITVSIVSHGQFKLLLPLLEDLKDCISLAKIILTINIKEEIKKPKWLNDLPIYWIFNKSVKGFGDNHNNAFKFCKTKYFCILNPDIRLDNKIFTDLISLKKLEKINIFGPSIVDNNKNKSINSRKFPDYFFLINRLFNISKKEYSFKQTQDVLFTDWIGGMFLMFASNDFSKLKGFDTDFFLYFEDVDICKRGTNIGFKVGQSRKIEVIHNAQRKSHYDLKHFIYHLKSYFLYLQKHGYHVYKNK